MAKDGELELNTEKAKDYIAQFQLLQAKYWKAKTWAEFSQKDIDKSSELVIRAEGFLSYALRRGKIPKGLAMRLDELIKWIDSLAK